MAKAERVGLSVWDRLVLLVAWAVTCGLVYVLGFYVGKGVQEPRAGMEDRIVRLPVTGPPPPPGHRASEDIGLTFYDTLVSGQHDDARVEPKPTPPAPAASAKPAAPPTTLAPAPASPAATLPPPRPAPASTVAVPRVSPPVPAPEAPKVATRPAPPPGSGWTVVAELTRSRDEAEGLERQLRGHGYDATVVRVARDGDTWYRVRVGRFSTNAQAEEIRQRLREREGIAHVFVASE